MCYFVRPLTLICTPHSSATTDTLSRLERGKVTGNWHSYNAKINVKISLSIRERDKPIPRSYHNLHGGVRGRTVTLSGSMKMSNTDLQFIRQRKMLKQVQHDVTGELAFVELEGRCITDCPLTRISKFAFKNNCQRLIKKFFPLPSGEGLVLPLFGCRMACQFPIQLIHLITQSLSHCQKNHGGLMPSQRKKSYVLLVHSC